MCASATHITIRVLFFGACKDIMKRDDMSLKVPPSSTVQDALALLGNESIQALSLAFAVNEELCKEDTLLQDEDCLALLPPVSGG